MAILPSGFNKDSISNLFGGNEGLSGGNFIQNLGKIQGNDVSDYANNVYNGTSHVHTPITNGVEVYIPTLTGDEGNFTIGINTTLLANKHYKISFDAKNIIGEKLLKGWYDGSSVYYFPTYINFNDGAISFIVTYPTDRSTVTRNLYFHSIDTDAEYKFEITNFKVEEVNPVEILGNYTDANRIEGQLGASASLLEQDSSGRVLSVAKGHSPIKHSQKVTTGFKPKYMQYTVTEKVSGLFEDLDSLGIGLGTFSQRTETRTLTYDEIVPDTIIYTMDTTNSLDVPRYTVIPDLYSFGTDTRAAYGGHEEPKILHVDTLAVGVSNTDDTHGSFEWCVNQDFPRVIVFDICGVIEGRDGNSGAPVYVRSPYCTIAGQTAPGHIVLNGSLGIITHDVVVI